MKKVILVTGTGRSGTSAFMNFLHTSSKVEKSKSPYIQRESTYWNDSADGGFEFIIPKMAGEDLHYLPNIIKDPRLIVTLKDTLRKNPTLIVEHLFICLRDFNQSALSRVSRDIDLDFKEFNGVKGEGGTEVEEHVDFFRKGFGMLFQTCAEYGIEVTVLHFPKFVKDPNYLFHKLKGTPLEMKYADVMIYHSRSMDKDKVNTYTTKGSSGGT